MIDLITNNWIKTLKVGDTVLTIEKWSNLMYEEWPSVITKIESSYIETEYVRQYRPEYENFLRAYTKNTVKNYFNPIDGTINIKPL